MTLNKALLALALAFILAAASNQPPAHAQNPSMDAANAAMFAAATNTDTSTPAKPKAAPAPQQQVIIVPPGARVIYAKPKPQRYRYSSIKIGNVTRIRFIDHELGVVCYFDNSHASHYGGQTDSCVHIPSLATYK